jgi:hypothetical protein
MPSNISFNPLVTSNVQGSFSVSSGGYVQGVALDDPSVRNYLAGGPLAVTETLPMWGGVAISEFIPATGTNSSVGSTVARATAITGGSNPITGFSVFNQAHAWVTSPQSECPSAAAGMTVPFYRLGSGARIALAIDPSMISLNGGLINQPVSWDFNNQRLAPVAGAATYAITSATGTYNNNGTWTVAFVMTAATPVGAIGDAINVSGLTGTGSNLINGNQIVSAFTDSQHFSITVNAGAGAIGAQTATSAVLNYDTVALPIKLLKLNVGNSKIVQYDSVNNYVHWANNGSTAIALI